MPESSPSVSLNSASPTLTRKQLLLSLWASYLISFAPSEIQENREQTVEAMNNVHATLNAFQEEFQNRLKQLGDDITKQINDEGEIFRDTWKHNHERM